MSSRAMVVACNFPPDASVGTMRTLRLVRHLAESGWDVDVVTVAPDGLRQGAVIDMALVDKIPREVTVVHARPLRPFERLSALVKRRPASRGNSGTSPIEAAGEATRVASPRSRTRRFLTAVATLPDREVSWLAPAVAAGWACARRRAPSVIYSSGPPFTAHLVGLALSRLTGRPWVADFRDPWARAPWRDDRFAFEKRVWSVLERLVVRSARAVVFVTDTNRRDFAREYGPAIASRFFLIQNGCDTTEFETLAPSRHGSGGPFVLLHAGSLYGGRNPVSLFRALGRAVATGRLDPAGFRLRFVGRIGVPGVDLRAFADDVGLRDVVEFVNHVPRAVSLQEMADASALLIVQPVTTVAIPAKLYEYMAAGKPILALAEPGGETSELMLRSNAGIAVPAGDETAIEHAVLTLVKPASELFRPVDRAFYDGAARAADLGRLLHEVATEHER